MQARHGVGSRIIDEGEFKRSPPDILLKDWADLQSPQQLCLQYDPKIFEDHYFATALNDVGSSSQADHLMGNAAMDDSIGGS